MPDPAQKPPTEPTSKAVPAGTSNARAGGAGARLPGVGDVVGALKILDYIESGGMAAIYRAMHTDLEVVRAVKVLKPGFTEESKQRFQTEAKLSANLHHPNIVQIYTVGLWEEALPYIEMEFVEGGSLADVLRDRRRLPPVVAAAIARIVCRALEFAAGRTFTLYGKKYQGLVHRDIKPANILIARSGTVKLVDFGIALPGSVSLHTTGPGLLGTFPYSSPEQLNNQKLDERTDVYSLGCVLYEMVAGEKAFPQKTMPDLIQHKTEGRYRPVHTQVPGISESLVMIITRSLALDRDKRYASPGEFGRELDKVLREQSGKPASVVVRSFIKNKKEPEFQVAADGKRPKGPLRAVLPYVLSFLAVALPMTAIVWSFGRFSGPARPTAQKGELHGADTAYAASPAPAAASAEPGREAAAGSETGAEQSAAQASPAPTQPRAGPMVVSLDPRNRFERHREVGLLAFERKNYLRAIEQLELAAADNAEDQAHQIVALRLMESYLETRSFDRARSLAQSRNLDDGYYLALCGRLYYELRDYAQCEALLTRAQSARSIFGPRAREEALYYTARLREVQYAGRPNVENRERALRAWQACRQLTCSQPSASVRCGEASSKIAELSR